LFFDPALRFPMLRMMRKLVRKKLGFRTLFDVIPSDGALVRGSHGLAAADPADRPVFAGMGREPFDTNDAPMASVFAAVLRHFGEDV